MSKSEHVRFHLEYSKPALASLDALKTKAGASSRAELVRRALSVYARIVDNGGEYTTGGKTVCLEVPR
jgi:metal-responsive CopG/Arc/MetJ family transcriptional regulator